MGLVSSPTITWSPFLTFIVFLTVIITSSKLPEFPQLSLEEQDSQASVLIVLTKAKDESALVTTPFSLIII